MVPARGLFRLSWHYDAVSLMPDERDLVSAFAGSRGGIAVSAAHLKDLSAALGRTLRPITRREEWHPMRSAWWIIPFALALAAEWWRRRHGLA